MSEGGERARLFFALWPSAAVRADLGRVFGMALAGAGGRPVPPLNLHLTLAFLGEVPRAELGTLEAIGAALELPAAVVALDRLDWWPRAAVLVAAASEPPAALARLQDELMRRLKEGGFRVDSSAFRPHVTLARKVRRRPAAAPAGTVLWPLGALALVASRPGVGGSSYTPLSSWESGQSATFS